MKKDTKHFNLRNLRIYYLIFNETELYFLLEVLGRFIEICDVEQLKDAKNLFNRLKRMVRK